MGTSPMKAFDIAKGGITDLRGQVFKWNKRDVLVTVHPSFVNRNRAFEEKFEEDIKMIPDLLINKKDEIVIDRPKVDMKNIKTGVNHYRIPDKFYTDEYRLVDIQYLNQKHQVLYIFRDKQNKKVYHTENDKYYYYICPSDVKAEKIVPYDKLIQSTCNYAQRAVLDHDTTYEGDLKLTQKHAIDYYLLNQGEAPRVDMNKMFWDIEIDTGNEKTFPAPDEAKYPINLITTAYHDKLTCYVIDNKSEPITPKEGVDLKIFKSEVAMLKTFVTDFKTTDPDFIAGWNAIAFDMEYLYNRLKRLKIPPTSFSKFGEFYVDAFRFICHLAGCVPLDQMQLYKMFTFTKKENYTLGFIGQEELKKTKIVMEYSFNEMYTKALNKLIEYNIQDVVLIKELEDKVKHINFLNEIRTICGTSFEAGSAVLAQVDSLTISFLKKQGMASKNGNPHIAKAKYPGAFVYEPIPGVYDNVTDFDFASLYPSLIITYNIGPNNFVMKFKNYQLGYDYAYNRDNIPDKVEVYMDPMGDNVLKVIKKNDLLKIIKDEKLTVTVNGCCYTAHDKEESVYNKILSYLLGSRKKYKGEMFKAIEAKDKENEEYFYARQYSYKVLANSLYGAIANKIFRFFDLSCAAAITLSGQEALKWSIIEGNAMMESLKTEKPIVRPAPITKIEMYDEKHMQKRKASTPYIVTGDTDSIFTCFQSFPQPQTTENVLKWCKVVQDYLNDEIMKEIVESRNVPFEHNRLVLKNELLISRGLFLAKKRYAIRVTNNEGKDVDQVNYMGIEIKRSDYPSKSKDLMKKILDILLKSETVSVSKLFDFINSQEKEFIELIKKGDKTIARPVSYGKKLKDYKTIPQGVRAMEAWNKVMYPIHTQGTKSYMFRVKGIDDLTAPEDVIIRYQKFIGSGNTFDVIAIPDDVEYLPPYIIPDVKGNLEFAFTARHDLLLAPLTKNKKQVTNVMTF